MKVLLALTCLFLFPLSTNAEEKKIMPSLFGVHLGMTYDEAHEVIDFLPVGKPQGDGTMVGYLNRDIANVLFEMIFTYNEQDHTVLDVSAFFPSDDFESVSGALVEKYGKGKTKRSIVTTGMGVEHEQINIYWAFPKASLYISRYGSTVDKSFVRLASAEADNKAEKKQKMKTDELKKGL